MILAAQLIMESQFFANAYDGDKVFDFVFADNCCQTAGADFSHFTIVTQECYKNYKKNAGLQINQRFYIGGLNID